MHQKHWWDMHKHGSTTFLVSWYPAPLSPAPPAPLSHLWPPFQWTWSISSQTVHSQPQPHFPTASNACALSEPFSIPPGNFEPKTAALFRTGTLPSSAGQFSFLAQGRGVWERGWLKTWLHPLSTPSGLNNTTVISLPGMLQSGSSDQKHLNVKIKASSG